MMLDQTDTAVDVRNPNPQKARPLLSFLFPPCWRLLRQRRNRFYSLFIATQHIHAPSTSGSPCRPGLNSKKFPSTMRFLPALLIISSVVAATHTSSTHSHARKSLELSKKNVEGRALIPDLVDSLGNIRMSLYCHFFPCSQALFFF